MSPAYFASQQRSKHRACIVEQQDSVSSGADVPRPGRGYRLQLFIALEFRGQPTTHSAAQDLLYKSLPIT